MSKIKNNNNAPEGLSLRKDVHAFIQEERNEPVTETVRLSTSIANSQAAHYDVVYARETRASELTKNEDPKSLFDFRNYGPEAIIPQNAAVNVPSLNLKLNQNIQISVNSTLKVDKSVVIQEALNITVTQRTTITPRTTVVEPLNILQYFVYVTHDNVTDTGQVMYPLAGTDKEGRSFLTRYTGQQLDEGHDVHAFLESGDFIEKEEKNRLNLPGNTSVGFVNYKYSKVAVKVGVIHIEEIPGGTQARPIHKITIYPYVPDKFKFNDYEILIYDNSIAYYLDTIPDREWNSSTEVTLNTTRTAGLPKISTTRKGIENCNTITHPLLKITKELKAVQYKRTASITEPGLLTNQNKALNTSSDLSRGFNDRENDFHTYDDAYDSVDKYDLFYNFPGAIVRIPLTDLQKRQSKNEKYTDYAFNLIDNNGQFHETECYLWYRHLSNITTVYYKWTGYIIKKGERTLKTYNNHKRVNGTLYQIAPILRENVYGLTQKPSNRVKVLNSNIPNLDSSTSVLGMIQRKLNIDYFSPIHKSKSYSFDPANPQFIPEITIQADGNLTWLDHYFPFGVVGTPGLFSGWGQLNQFSPLQLNNGRLTGTQEKSKIINSFNFIEHFREPLDHLSLNLRYTSTNLTFNFSIKGTYLAKTEPGFLIYPTHPLLFTEGFLETQSLYYRNKNIAAQVCRNNKDYFKKEITLLKGEVTETDTGLIGALIQSNADYTFPYGFNFFIEVHPFSFDSDNSTPYYGLNTTSKKAVVVIHREKIASNGNNVLVQPYPYKPNTWFTSIRPNTQAVPFLPSASFRFTDSVKLQTFNLNGPAGSANRDFVTRDFIFTDHIQRQNESVILYLEYVNTNTSGTEAFKNQS